MRHYLAVSPRSCSDREDQRRRVVADAHALVALGVEVEQLSNGSDRPVS
jgi:hypothetical protein